MCLYVLVSTLAYRNVEVRCALTFVEAAAGYLVQKKKVEKMFYHHLKAF